jgi:hypothetical protein
MQNVTVLNPSVESTRARQTLLTWELAAYAALTILALVLRLADLDLVPITSGEAGRALAAWRHVSASAPGVELLTDSPLLFAAQSFSFTLIGGNEFAARVLTALAGAALVLSPVLFRRLIGAPHALVMTALLCCSPVVLTASRFSSPVVWSLVAAVLTLWALWHYWETRSLRDAVLAMIFASVLKVLSEPGGPLLALMISAALVIAVLWTRRDGWEPDEADQSLFAGWFLKWPWSTSLLVSVLVIVTVATGLLLNPSGLTTVGELLAGTIAGFGTPAEPSVFAYPLAISVFYDTPLWVLAIVGVVLALRRDQMTLIERFWLVWVVLAVVVSLLFRGAEAAHGLWFVIPLAGLSASAVTEMIADERRYSLWHIPSWAKWLVAVGMIAALAAFTMTFQSVARSLVAAPEIGFDIGTLNPAAMIILLVTVMFVIVGYFMTASLWNNGVALRGIGLGVVIFGAVTALGSGWNAAVTDAGNPVELWHLDATSSDAHLLRATLRDISLREARGFSDVEISVLAPQDGVLAWLVRDYPAVRFITSPDQARGQGVVLLPNADIDAASTLGGSYVGQDFTISRTWSPSTVAATDLPAWWTQRRTRIAATSVSSVVLWLRQDIYQGVDPQSPGQTEALG